MADACASGIQAWNPTLDGLAAERGVIAVDLPGFGATPPLAGQVSIRTLANAVTGFLAVHHLNGVDAVGSRSAPGGDRKRSIPYQG